MIDDLLTWLSPVKGASGTRTYTDAALNRHPFSQKGVSMQHVIVAGSTGLVGSELIRQLKERSGVRVTALVRRPCGLSGPPSVTEKIFDFASESAYAEIGTDTMPCDVLLCAVGTTIRKAGSRAAFVAIDRDIPLRLAAALASNNPKAVFGFVSSIGADRPRGFYLQTKAAVEAGLAALGMPHVLARPSLLLGERAESRPMEELMSNFLPSVFNLGDLVGLKRALNRYRPIAATYVARALLQQTLNHGVSGRVLIEGDAFYKP